MLQRSLAHRTACRYPFLGPVLVALAVAAPAFAAPRAVLVEPLQVNRGEIEPDAIQKLDWTLRNDGDAPLLVLSVEPTCYCTTAKIESKQVAPGATTKIHVTIDPSDFVGEIHKGFELETNDPQTPRALTDITMIVRPGIAVVPPEVDFGTVPAAGSAEFKVDLKAAKARAFKVTAVTSEAAYVSVEQEPLSIEERAGVRLFVKVKPGAPAGAFTSKIVVTTDDAAKPRIEIAVRGTGAGGLHADPVKLVFEATSAGNDIGTVVISGDKSHKVVGVKSSSPLLEPAISPQPDGSYRVQVKLAANAKPGRVFAKLLVATDDTAQPELAVPVTGLVK